ncbi:ATP-dependent nuclease [Aeromicrobium tamlense]|uniref:Energy-coupling factor transporter ATP-binding protein EcfA2 n=1 Tax=Aeromicrobium tamlense TaxID=375541 RepID=A0ABX2SDY7_9ACTN|nr:energy-coupling factor transporter ATP-binding protein EcfA2 [Aeromicrobium tamlense]
MKDFRSFVGEHDFDLSSGVNYFVGPNNCGKSNLIAALVLALDPDARYDSALDRPAQTAGMGAPPKTRITLTVLVGSTPVEKTLLARARAYEMAVRESRGIATTGNVQTYADEKEVRLVVTFTGAGARQVAFQAKGQGAASLTADADESQKLYEQFSKSIRLVVLHSGEDLAQVLQGRFRDILHYVIRDHLATEVGTAEAARETYIRALQEQLLGPLQKQVEGLVNGLFPEIEIAELVPDIPGLMETLSSVDVRLHDAALTQLAGKGTGVRGAVLVAMLQYLVEQSRRSLVLAVEEPEAFLHPAAQEAVMTRLESLAQRPDVTLVVTTHSPYVVSQKPEARVSSLRKDAEGRTTLADSVSGDGDLTQVLGPLFRDSGFARVIQKATAVPPGTRGVVITEGYTDGFFVQTGCKVASREQLLDGIHFIPAGKAAQVVVQAILATAASDLPVVALLDFDDNGRAARDRLKDMNWNPKRELLMLSDWPNKCKKGHDVEIEDLIPNTVVEKLIAKSGGEAAAIDGKENCDVGWHYRPNVIWKEAAIDHLGGTLKKADCSGLIWVAEAIDSRVSAIAAAKAKSATHKK